MLVQFVSVAFLGARNTCNCDTFLIPPVPCLFDLSSRLTELIEQVKFCCDLDGSCFDNSSSLIVWYAIDAVSWTFVSIVRGSRWLL